MHRRELVNGKTSVRKKITQPKPELPVEGWPRPYLRDGVPGLPIERQEEMLAELGLDLAEDKTYVDEMGRARIAKRVDLVRRNDVVSPPHRGEVVYLAGLRVLGWDHLDVLRAMSRAFEHGARIYCADTRSVYSADTPAEEVSKMLIRAEEARRRARTRRATEGSVQRREQRVNAGVAIAEPLWSGYTSMSEIERLSGLGRRVLYVKLGPRSIARDEVKNGK
jgi:hypothetical protein